MQSCVGTSNHVQVLDGVLITPTQQWIILRKTCIGAVCHTNDSLHSPAASTAHFSPVQRMWCMSAFSAARGVYSKINPDCCRCVKYATSDVAYCQDWHILPNV